MGGTGGIAKKVWELAEPLASELGLSVWDVAFTKEGADWSLQIFIDKEGGVGIDDCVDMTHAIDPVLDREDPIPQQYTLVVSSPGVNRKLKRKEHFEKYIGSKIKVRLIRPDENGQKELSGTLLGVSENGDFEIQTDAGTGAVFAKKDCSSVNLLDEDFEF